MFYRIDAGSSYGYRRCWYELVESHLVLRDEGDHDNLAGKSVACDFEGLTLDEAHAKADALNSEGSGHSYDGCHACRWSIDINQGDDGYVSVPGYLTYSAPQEAEIIKAALAVYRKECGSMGKLKKAVRAIQCPREVRVSNIEKLQGRTWESLAIEVASQTGMQVDHLHAIRDEDCIGHWDAACGIPSSKWFGEQLPVQFDEVVIHAYHD